MAPLRGAAGRSRSPRLAVGWYAADSLRHRREGAFGYEIATDLDVGSENFLRAAEALTGAPISEGNEVELLINGDRIFPAFLETIASAERTLNVQTYVYWRGDIAREVAGAICEQGGERASGATSSSTRSVRRRWSARWSARCATPAPGWSCFARRSPTRSSGSPTARTGASWSPTDKSA